ncbi:hypothetical protein OLX02_11150 [Novosphingobium sp. KCTC 2891]|uniref:hypothetical protein n=1 Tax=Novosphingobium sp. KCTC 2891 TaxID=2989730 RepID=UPI0022214136|nr:hypothetical protein [Novosphingobium sp. KCTC 2891]MCW1383377.1 hypothetical protein [Novosphingobium sp. KCTC 2891]
MANGSLTALRHSGTSMAAAAPLLGIDPKMYRHFAALTLVISISVAIFADSDQEESIAAQVQQQEHQAELKRQETEKAKPKPVLVDARGGGWGSESGDFGAPMDSGGSDGGSVVVLPPPMANTIQVEVDPRMLAQMTPAQRQAYLKKLDEEKRRREAQGPYRPTTAELQSLRSASALRSGSEGDD